MERLEHYRECVRKLLTEQATLEERNPDIECQLVVDAEHDHYQLLDVGWEGLKRVYNCFIHLDIKDGKIWIQRNMTEVDIARELVKMGVPKEDIVLGLHPPYKRPYTGYGVA
ncbi:XisI protein [Coleofasciculus sp. FACHB-712]|uniref:XisI protein n=1 Tax=Cyanophyceae TaxID=3028117 RepID=UPI001682954F|nr:MULTISPECIES: XisI protein [unclassified Coleofasciculus]MBD1942398.1 XisI protein [Coleofasciculus sp. FACHB-712]MBD2542150.1 XisI protein [Coleofasciculus sp. FACHB-SPT36]